MSLQSIYDVLNPLAEQGALTLLDVEQQVPQVSLLAFSLPAPGGVTIASATLALSGSGADQSLTITAQVSWGLFSNIAATIEITLDPTADGQYMANIGFELGDNSGLGIPGITWFEFSQVSVNAQTNPYLPVKLNTENAVEVFLNTTLIINGDSSQTPIPIQMSYDSGGAIQTTLNTSSIDLPSINDILAAFGSDTSGINLPDGLNSLLSFSLEEVAVGFTPPSSVTRIGVTIGNSAKETNGWVILPGVFTIQSYTIGLTVANPLDSATRQVSGLIETEVTLGTVDVDVAAIHPSTGGWQFSGSIGKENPVPIGEIVSGIGQQFGVPMPAALNEFTLSDFEFQFNTQTAAASGQFTVDFTFNGSPIELTIMAAMQKSGDTYTARSTLAPRNSMSPSPA